MYPERVYINESKITRITNTYKGAYKNILKEINTATDFGVANRKAILSQIEIILVKLGINVNDFIEKEIPSYYKQGADEAVKQLKNSGIEVSVSEGFNRIHNEAVKALVDTTARAFGETMTSVNRTAQLILGRAVREAITQKMATGMIAGDALRQVKREIKGLIAEQGLDVLVDKGGHTWTLDRYTEMLFRTKMVEARNRGLVNRMVENGHDLVQVSSHSGSCEFCAPWQGKILSITGDTPGYTTVAEAEVDGLFHPNCRHAINTLIPGLARLTSAYDPLDKPVVINKKTYSPIIIEKTQKVLNSAKAYNDVFISKVAKIAENTGLKYEIGPLKGIDRAVEKVVDDYKGDITKIKDLNRSVIFINNMDDLKRVEAAVIQEFGRLDRLKDSFDIQGYKRVMLNVKTDYGNAAEIQITTPEMWEAKIKNGGDKLYHVVRINAKDWEKAQAKMDFTYAEADVKFIERLRQ